MGGGGFEGGDIDGAQGAAHGGDGLEGAADDDGLAVGHAALEAAGAVGEAGPAAVGVDGDFVVDVVAAGGGVGEGGADFGALDGVDADDGLGEAGIELAVPLDVAAKTDGGAPGDDFEDAAEGGALSASGIDLGHHFVGALRGDGADGGGFDVVPGPVLGAGVVEAGFVDDGAYAGGAAADGDAELGEEFAGDGADGDAGSGFAGAGAFEDVAQVASAILDHASEVGVTRAGLGDGRHVVGRGLNGHFFTPVGPVAVLDEEGDGAAEGFTETNAAADDGLITLDLHAAAAAVAALTAREVGVDVLDAEGDAEGQAFDDDGEAGAVGFAGGQVAEVGHGVSLRFQVRGRAAGAVFSGVGCAEDPSPISAGDGGICLSPWRG